MDGELYRTVGTPTDLSRTGAPAHSYDTIYAIEGQRNVATAAPGDRGFNGGRWMVRRLDIGDYPGALKAADANGSGDLDSAAEVESARAAGFIDHDTVVKSFECPVIKMPRWARPSARSRHATARRPLQAPAPRVESPGAGVFLCVPGQPLHDRCAERGQQTGWCQHLALAAAAAEDDLRALHDARIHPHRQPRR